VKTFLEREKLLFDSPHKSVRHVQPDGDKNQSIKKKGEWRVGHQLENQ
jgi:hypothetical protein